MKAINLDSVTVNICKTYQPNDCPFTVTNFGHIIRTNSYTAEEGSKLKQKCSPTDLQFVTTAIYPLEEVIPLPNDLYDQLLYLLNDQLTTSASKELTRLDVKYPALYRPTMLLAEFS